MNRAILIVLPLVAACTPTIVSPNSVAGKYECEQLYDHMINMSVNDRIDPQSLTTPDMYQAFLKQARDRAEANGLEKDFYAMCVGHITQVQFHCALQQNHLDDIQTCTPNKRSH